MYTPTYIVNIYYSYPLRHLFATCSVLKAKQTNFLPGAAAETGQHIPEGILRYNTYTGRQTNILRKKSQNK